MKPKVYIKFPKTGLGNMMLVWARGIVFAQLNNLPVVASTWWGLHWGALLRREKQSRLYFGYFKESSLQDQMFVKLTATIKPVEFDPIIHTLSNEKKNEPKLYIFNKVITDNDLFGSLRSHETIIKIALENALTLKMKLKLSQFKAPVIGVHIRRGDFKLGNQTTALSYFIESIQAIRIAIGEDLPVTIFSDADEYELKDVLALPNVALAETKPDILDILLLSKSKYIILSRSSTFGYWAAFLSQAFVIRPLDDWQVMIKPNNENYKEIKWDVTKDKITDFFSGRIK